MVVLPQPPDTSANNRMVASRCAEETLFAHFRPFTRHSHHWHRLQHLRAAMPSLEQFTCTSLLATEHSCAVHHKPLTTCHLPAMNQLWLAKKIKPDVSFIHVISYEPPAPPPLIIKNPMASIMYQYFWKNVFSTTSSGSISIPSASICTGARVFHFG